jgi:lipid II:glycine glycyltransferase (peptidoglycan interpeptide bridge formation enzyme)
LDDTYKSVFFHPEFYRSYQNVNKAQTECFGMQKDENNFLFYPFLLNSINALGYELDEEFFDIQGAYGYNGPIGKAEDKEFLIKFNSELKSYLQSKKVITEFVRYCPIVKNNNYHTYPHKLNVLDNVYLDLSKGIDWIWHKSFESKVRRAIKKADKYGLEAKIFIGDEITETLISQFYDIYKQTMQRAGADSFYFFNHDFFSDICNYLKNKILLVFTYLENVPVSTELLFVDGALVYGFLGGTLSDYYQYKANTFQRWEFIKYLIKHGFQSYSMGGGATRNDSIYKFKKSFAHECENPFYIGTYIHNETVYNNIVKQWQDKYPNQNDKENRLQCYRFCD